MRQKRFHGPAPLASLALLTLGMACSHPMHAAVTGGGGGAGGTESSGNGGSSPTGQGGSSASGTGGAMEVPDGGLPNMPKAAVSPIRVVSISDKHISGEPLNVSA